MAVRFCMISFAILVFMGGVGAGEDKTPFPDRIKVGEWATYRVNGNDNLLIKQSIVSIEGVGETAVITYRNELMVNGKVASSAERTKTRAQVRADDAKTMEKVVRSETVEIQGKKIVAEVTESEIDGKKNIFYGSDDIPVSGVIKWIVPPAKIPKTELVDFGGR